MSSTQNLFEKATRLKLRFETAVGQLAVEDLWDLPLDERKVNLNNIARSLYQALKQDDEISFVTPKKKNTRAQLGFDIVKHIIDIKLAERDKAQAAAASRAKLQQIQGFIAQKETAEMLATPLEDLRKMLEAEAAVISQENSEE